MTKMTQTEWLYKTLKEKIDQGVYSPAESLPEMELSREYQVSRNTVKKALLMLENDYYVTIEPNKGAKVRSYSKNEVLEFLQLREVLEGFVIRLAIPCMQQKDVDELRDTLERMATKKKEGDLFGYSDLNRYFHSIIYRVCPNRTAVSFTVSLKNQMKKYNSKTVLVPNRCDRSLEEHRQIFEAICNRDVERGEYYMRQHIRNVRDTFDKYFSVLF